MEAPSHPGQLARGALSPAQMATPGRAGAAPGTTLPQVQVVAPRILPQVKAPNTHTMVPRALPQMVAPRARTQLAAPRTLSQTVKTVSPGLTRKIVAQETKVAMPNTQTDVTVSGDVPGTQAQMVLPGAQTEMAAGGAQVVPEPQPQMAVVEEEADALGGPKHLVYKKVIKPLIEKKRRERINASLSRLRTLLQDPPKPGRKQSHSSRLDKAHILELAVLRVQGLQQAANQEEGFSAGFTRCLSLIDAFLASQAQLGSALQPKLAEYLSSALRPTQPESQGSALQPMQADDHGSALPLMQVDDMGSAHQLIQADHQGSALQLIQADHQGSALQLIQAEHQGSALQLIQADHQGSALQAEQEENNAQVHQMSQTSTFRPMQVQNRCSIFHEKQGENHQGGTLQLFQESVPQYCARRPVMQGKDQNSAHQLPQGIYQSSALRPQLAENHDDVLQTTQTKNLGSALHMVQETFLLHQSSKNPCSAVQLQQSENQGSTPLVVHAAIQDSGLRTMPVLKEGNAVRSLETQNQGHAWKCQQNQTSVLPPLQITNQGSVLRNLQTQNYGNVLGHIQTQSMGNAGPPTTGVPHRSPQIHSKESRLHELKRPTPKKEKGHHDKENQSHEQNIHPGPTKLWHSSDQTPSPWERPVDCRPQPWKGARRLAFTPPESEAAEMQEAHGTPIQKRALSVLRQARDQRARTQAPIPACTGPSAGPPMGCSPAPWQCPLLDPMWRPW